MTARFPAESAQSGRVTSESQSRFQEKILTELTRKGFDFIQFIPPPGLIQRVMEGWNEFLKMPLETRLKWRVGNADDWDDGYVPRIPKGASGMTIPCDNKDFFHYRPHLYALLDHVKTDYTTQETWLNDLEALWKQCRWVFEKTLENLDIEVPGFDFSKRFLSPVAQTRHVLRLLSYREKLLPGQVLGKAHIDRNLGTIQVYETHPALVLNFPSVDVKYQPLQNKALFFTGAKAEKLTGGILKGVKHNIVVPDTFVPNGENELRQSIVFFGHIYPEE